jgi:hypothetical protein
VAGAHPDTRGKTVTIYVNTEERQVDEKELTFEEVVALAAGLPSGPNVLYVVTYSKSAGKKEEGSLVAGQSVKIKNGTVFSVRATTQS